MEGRRLLGCLVVWNNLCGLEGCFYHEKHDNVKLALSEEIAAGSLPCSASLFQEKDTHTKKKVISSLAEVVF